MAKCNLGKVKLETMLASALHHQSYVGRSWGEANPLCFFRTVAEVNHFACVAFVFSSSS